MAAAAAGVVVVGLLATCAVADLEFYPGLQFDLNQGERTSPHLENLDESFYTEPIKRWPWKNLDPEYDAESTLRHFNFLDKLLEFQELEDAAAEAEGAPPPPKTRRRRPFEEAAGALRPPGPNLGQYRRHVQLAAAAAAGPHHRQPQRVRDLLDAVLQQRQQHAFSAAFADADKLFGTEEDEDEYSDTIGKDPQANDIEDNAMGSMGSMGFHEGYDNEDYQLKKGEEFPDRFKEVPVEEDPAQFAYAPPDPRFYEKTGVAQNERPMLTTNTPLSRSLPDESGPKMNINTRSETENPGRENVEDIVIENGKQDGTKEVVVVKSPQDPDSTTVYIIAMVAGISAAATVGLIAIGIGWFNLQRHMKNAEESDYPSYGIVGPNKDYDKRDREETAGDRRLAQSAQMYHYQHQKQQIIAMGRNTQGGHGSVSDTDEEEDEEGNYTVYECPGLASIEGPLEVKNPMFDDDQLATPSQTPSKPTESAKEAK